MTDERIKMTGKLFSAGLQHCLKQMAPDKANTLHLVNFTRNYDTGLWEVAGKLKEKRNKTYDRHHLI